MRGWWQRAVVAAGLAGWVLAGTAAAGAAAELSVDEIAEMEQLLLDLNFDPGKIDGVADARTRTAIRLYQEFSALPADGEPTAKLLRELRQVTQALADMRAKTEQPAAETAAPKAAEPAVTQAAEPATAAAPAPGPVEAPEPAHVDAPEPALAQAPEAVPEKAPEPAVAEAAKPVEETASEPATAQAPEPPSAAIAESKIAAAEAPAAPKAAEAPALPKAAEEFNLSGMIARLKQQHTDDPAASATPAAPATAVAAATDPAGRERTLIWRVQQELRRIGLDPGAADGNLRPRTTRAIETYQRARGVPADGRVSAELLARLGAEATPAGPTAPVDGGVATASAGPGAQVAALDPTPANGYAAFKAGFGAAQAGNFDLALQRYNQAIDSGDLSLEHLAAALYNRANAYHYLGIADKAIEDYSAAIANKPRFPDAYYNRGFAYDLKGEQTRAVEDFRTARDLGLQRLGVRAPDLQPPY